MLRNVLTFFSNIIHIDLTLRSSYNLLLKAPAHSSTFYSNSFTVRDVNLWNSLPIDVRRAKTFVIFKNLLMKHYLSLT